ncbi:endonuclease III domain-containing protein [Desulfovibrio cuneatus]|uniref:endonuclease III domain-containing protein n=1 Tax=Desulfovibrio cuneatus TaxID=159728 RepID=UPI0003F8389C|nr:endonuclease [Desulfovibrio cuneatus]
MQQAEMLLQYYAAMHRHFGPSHWWPGETPFEVAVGAVLTQNTAWRNVEKAMGLLRQANALSPLVMHELSLPELEACLLPSGFYRMKAQRLRALLAFFARVAGQASPPNDPSLAFLRHLETETLRPMLLEINGIGPETADCILLYALQRPVFVVDAYTRRMCSRHGVVPPKINYHELQAFFSDVLPQETALFNEYHALIVRTGKEFCAKSKPRCKECPLGGFLERAVE